MRILAVIFIAAITSPASALPVYRKMVKQKAGRMVSCLLCHDKDSWDPNAFGLEFLKAGRSPAALDKAAAWDVDMDGFKDLDELKAGSSPIDPRSTPEKPGEWLKKVPPLRAPEKQLRKIFADAASFRPIEDGESTSSDVAKLADVLGRPPRDEERLQVYYEALKDEKRVGAATYATTEGDEPIIVMVGLGQDGRVASVVRVHSEKKLDPAFLARFSGLDEAGLAALEKEKLPAPNADIAGAVRAASAALNARLSAVK